LPIHLPVGQPSNAAQSRLAATAPGPVSIKGGRHIFLTSWLATEAMSSNSKLDGLEAWMHDKGFVWNPSTVTLCGGTDGEVGFAVAAAREIAEHDTLCEIPKDAVLSVRNSAIANLIEQEQLNLSQGFSKSKHDILRC